MKLVDKNKLSMSGSLNFSLKAVLDCLFNGEWAFGQTILKFDKKISQIFFNKFN